MKPITLVIPEGQKIVQLAPGKTLSLSSSALVALEITIKTFKPTRSKSQNGLAWMWADYLASITGRPKEEHYAMFKLDHVGPVLARDDSDFGVLFDEFKGMFFGKEGTRLYAKLADGFISASKCNTSQMAEALTHWEIQEAGSGNVLPRPDDYLFSLQIKSYKQLPESGQYSK